MKKYEPIKILITAFNQLDVLLASGQVQGINEGVNELNPTTRPDWF